MATTPSPISIERLVVNVLANQLNLSGYTGRVLESALLVALKTYGVKIVPIEHGDDK